jgi:diguanylate cyclase (GGDEF)-like protein
MSFVNSIIGTARLLRRGGGERDAVRVLCGILLAYSAAIVSGLVEQMHAFLERHDEIYIDQISVLGALTIVGLLIFGALRGRDQRKEITLRIEAERQLQILAFHDPLTGMPNRRQLMASIEDALGQLPEGQGSHALFLLDLNGFKKVNDVFGHPAGDEVLRCIARRLQAQVGDQRLIARLGGDEFAVLSCNLDSREQAKHVLRRITAVFEKPFSAAGNRHMLGAGVGVALCPQDGCEASELMRRADIALYQAKRRGPSEWRFFEADMDEKLKAQAKLDLRLRAALAAGKIVPHYQPIIDLRTGQISGFEALARWPDPERGFIPPNVFIPVAEDAGSIVGVTELMFRAACQDAANWPDEVRLSVNLSAVLLKDPTLAIRLLAIMLRAGLPPSRMEIEVTETALVADLEAAQEVLGALRIAGVSIALDDFGTGYASILHLRNFQFDVIKIDKSYVDDLGKDVANDFILRSMITLGHGLGLAVTAEGIEDSNQREVLTQLGCRFGQGFLFGRPIPADEVASMINGSHRMELQG